MKKPQQNKNTTRRFLALGTSLALALTVLLGGCAYQNFGWRGGQVYLDTANATGETALLNGFTLSGVTGNVQTKISFLIKDGALQQKLLPASASDRSVNYMQGDYQFTLPQSLRASAESAAQDNGSQYTGMRSTGLFHTFKTYGTNYYYETDTLACILNLRVQEKDITRTARFYLGQTTAETAQSLNADIENQADGTTVVHDYGRYSLSDGLVDAWKGCVNQSPAVLQLGDAAYFALDLPESELSPGLYRLTQLLDEEEVAALPTDGTLAGTPLTYNTTGYGSAEQVFPLPTGASILRLGSMGEEPYLLYILSGQLHLLTRQGDVRVWDKIAGVTHPLQSLRADEIAFLVEGETENEICALRMENGVVTVSQSALVPISEHTTAACAGLNEDGTALLVADNVTVRGFVAGQMKNISAQWREQAGITAMLQNAREVPDRIQLSVYRQGNATVTPDLSIALHTAAGINRGTWFISEPSLSQRASLSQFDTIYTPEEQAQIWEKEGQA